MWLVGGSISPSGTNGTIGATRASPSLRAIASVVARSTTLCLPATRYGPFCSMPPVATIAVFLPALMASRTSIQVMSSMNTVSRAGIGRGASGSGRIGSGRAGALLSRRERQRGQDEGRGEDMATSRVMVRSGNIVALARRTP